MSPLKASVGAADAAGYADWLKTEIGLIESYHNHKETMAWTATAFYLPGITGLAYIMGSVQWGCVGYLLFSLLLIVIALAILFFVNMQFEMMWKASDMGDGLRRAIARVYSRFPPILRADLQVARGSVYPRFVDKEIEAEIKRSMKLRTFIKFLEAIRDMIIFRWNRPDNRIKTELASYLAITLVTLFAIFLVWR